MLVGVDVGSVLEYMEGEPRLFVPAAGAVSGVTKGHAILPRTERAWFLPVVLRNPKER